MNIRILAAATAFAALAIAFSVSADANDETLTIRIDNAIHDIEAVTAPIPHAVLHAKALELLRERAVAEDDEPSKIDDRRAIDLSVTSTTGFVDVTPCIAFTKTSMEKVACNPPNETEKP